ncbi:hypothetical protein IC757_11085 [Wenzhouxiangella sp. AB-CW3]|uniref:hypothetical protein n=1 Tax=Wenzhouxiangella sp. AB-CW3 TaxID=2771012 RepID=UPI00168C09AA|nr:hypothetical protein [Wenzhouxiangella sp. AB-CW3]QOC21584.1 hypothetical protein IC757_11085 [Wenzhouxiangella sp. AB-CW3]
MKLVLSAGIRLNSLDSDALMGWCLMSNCLYARVSFYWKTLRFGGVVAVFLLSVCFSAEVCAVGLSGEVGGSKESTDFRKPSFSAAEVFDRVSEAALNEGHNLDEYDPRYTSVCFSPRSMVWLVLFVEVSDEGMRQIRATVAEESGEIAIESGSLLRDEGNDKESTKVPCEAIE